MNLSIFSWVIYDIGNTLFNAGVTGLFFPLWIITKLNGTDATVGYTLSLALLISLIISPIVGTISDQTRNRKIFLGIFTVICGLSTTFIGNDSLIDSLFYYGVSVTCLHVGDIFYNSMLKDVSNKNNIGIIGGIGAGVGYIGAIIAILIGLLIIEDQGPEFKKSFASKPLPIVVLRVGNNTKYQWTADLSFKLKLGAHDVLGTIDKVLNLK